jgi:hypothetical protein
MSINIPQLADDVVVEIAALDWPEMYPCGYHFETGNLIGPNREVGAMHETSRGTIMLCMLARKPMRAEFKEFDDPDLILHRAIAIEFMGFCTGKG